MVWRVSQVLSCGQKPALRAVGGVSQEQLHRIYEAGEKISDAIMKGEHGVDAACEHWMTWIRNTLREAAEQAERSSPENRLERLNLQCNQPPQHTPFETFRQV